MNRDSGAQRVEHPQIKAGLLYDDAQPALWLARR
jgi:hypothetical protein